MKMNKNFYIKLYEYEYECEHEYDCEVQYQNKRLRTWMTKKL